MKMENNIEIIEWKNILMERCYPQEKFFLRGNNIKEESKEVICFMLMKRWVMKDG
jgi:hypothetical protein